MAIWDKCLVEGVATIGCLEPLFENTLNAILGLSAIGLFVMFVAGGFSFLFSGGDQKKTEQAKGTLTNAVIGLVIIVAAFLFLRTIGVFTGVDVTKFMIPSNAPKMK